MSTTPFITLILIAFTVIATGCKTQKTAAVPADPKILYLHTWQLETLEGDKIKRTAPERIPYIIFHADKYDRLTGMAGCNQLNGGVEVAPDLITFTNFSTTRKFCADDRLEEPFLAVLNRTKKWSTRDQHLVLFDGKEELATFIPLAKEDPSAPKTTLEGTWQLTAITSIDTPLTALYPETRPLLIFNNANKDRVGGNTGCNVFSSTVKMDGNKITISPPETMTMRYCEGGGEETYLNGLTQATTYSIKGRSLYLYRDEIEVMRFDKK